MLRRSRAAGHSPQDGFTLLEVLLATAILAVALTAVGQLASNGRRAALRAERESLAALFCASTLDRILSGAATVDEVNGTTHPDGAWTITAIAVDGPTPTLSRLTVRVESSRAGAPASYELIRLVAQEDLEPNEFHRELRQ